MLNSYIEENMKTLKQNYILSYNEFKNAPWMSEVKTEISRYITDLTNSLQEEANNCYDSDLLNPDYMYGCFKSNIQNCEYNGNWTILKYFTRMLEIKVYNEMIGNWLYTEEDKEMYEYFFNMKVEPAFKAKPAILKYNNEPLNIFNYITVNAGKQVFIEFKSDCLENVFSTNYYNLFQGKLTNINNLLSKAKLLKTAYPSINLFDKEYETCITLLTWCKNSNTNLNDILSKSYTEIKANWKKEQEKREKVKNSAVSFYDGMAKFVDKDPLYHKLQSELNLMYYRLIQEYKKTDEGQELYELLNDEQKARLENMSYFE